MEGEQGLERATVDKTEMRGWLKKQGEGALKGWKKRFFRQVGSQLHYFMSDADCMNMALSIGFIDISQVSDVFVVAENLFDVVTPGRAYHFQLIKEKSDEKSEKVELQYWIDGLSSLMHFYEHENEEQHLKQEQKGLKLMKGWLRKQGEGTLRGWKKRFFKQDGSKLYYFLSDVEKDALGHIDLSKVLKIIQVSDTQFDLIATATAQTAQALRGLGYKFDVRSSFDEANSGTTTVKYQLQTIANKGEEPESVQPWIEGLSNWIKFYRLEAPPVLTTQSSTGSLEKEVEMKELSDPQIEQAQDHHTPEQSLEPPELPLKKKHEEIVSPKDSEKKAQSEASPEILSNTKKQGSLMSELTPVIVGLAPVVTLGIFSSWTFIAGALFGVLLCLILLGAGLIYVLSRPSGNEEPLVLDFSKISILGEKKPTEPDLSSSKIQRETYEYIINFLLARFLREHLSNEGFKEKYKERLNLRLKESKKPGFLGDMAISSIDFGNNSFEIVNGVKLLKPTVEGEFRGAFYMRYQGDSPAQVKINVTVFINWPKEHFASVPVNMSLTMEHLSGPMLIVIPPGPDPLCTLSFTGDPLSKWSFGSGVGSKNQLKNIPKISQFFVGKLQQFLKKDLMVPNGIGFHIPIKGERPLKVRLLRKLREMDNTVPKEVWYDNTGAFPPKSFSPASDDSGRTHQTAPPLPPKESSVITDGIKKRLSKEGQDWGLFTKVTSPTPSHDSDTEEQVPAITQIETAPIPIPSPQMAEKQMPDSPRDLLLGSKTNSLPEGGDWKELEKKFEAIERGPPPLPFKPIGLSHKKDEEESGTEMESVRLFPSIQLHPPTNHDAKPLPELPATPETEEQQRSRANTK